MHIARHLEQLMGLMQDVRYTLRGLRRNPVFAAVAIATLAIGIGANTAIFSLVDAVLLRPLPYPDAERLVAPRMVVTRAQAGSRRLDTWSYPKFELLRQTTRTLEGVSAFAAGPVSLSGRDTSELIQGELVSATYFPLLGIQTVRGRVFSDQEDRTVGGAPVVAISYAIWQRRFAGAADVVGRAIEVNQIPLTIVGVLARGFGGQAGDVDVWIPMAMAPAVLNAPDRLTEAQAHWHQVIARTRQRIGPDQIRQDAEVIASAIQRELPMGDSVALEFQPLIEAKVDPAIRSAVLMLFGAVGLVLIIACTNMAGLLLTRAAGRRREIAIRLSVGASRAAIVRQLLVESVVMSICGAVAGLLVALWTIDVLASFKPQGTEGVWRSFSAMIRPDTVSFSGLALAFHLIAAIAAGFLFGLVPAIHACRTDLGDALKVTAGRPVEDVVRILRLNARTAIVASQLALALVLVSSAGIMIKSFTRLLTSVTGFTAERVITARVTLPGRQYAGREAQFFDEVLQRLSTYPGVARAAVTAALPLTREPETTTARLENGDGNSTGVQMVSPDFFGVLGIAITRGRAFDERDRADAPHVAMVNEQFVRQYLPGRDPLGQRVSLGLNGWGPRDRPAEIIGVVGDVKYRAAERELTPQVYLSYRQRARTSMVVTVRSVGDPLTVVPEIRRAIAAVDRTVPAQDVLTMGDVIATATSRGRFTAQVLGAFAVIAIALAAVGMYGVAAHASSSRVREFALRMALGARRGEVLRMVLAEAGGLALIATAFGAPAAWAASRLLTAQVYQVESQDPMMIAGVAALLVAVALIATWLPARRAVRVDPSAALRCE
jgi:putative ABC transport system permease protein